MAEKRILYISGSLGLGHVVRDLAIAKELRRQNPEAKVCWIAAGPAASLLKEEGEELLPEADLYADNNVPAERAAKTYGLNLMKYTVGARKAWERNVDVFRRLMLKSRFDVIIGDETYEIAFALQKKRVSAQAPFVMIYDFVGCDSVSISPVEKLAAYLWNRLWAGSHRLFSDGKNLALFVGEPEDIPDKSFGPFLPRRRDWAKTHYRFIGHVLSFRPEEYTDRASIREKLGYAQKRLVVCSIGGTAIGKDLLELSARAYPIIRRQVPDVHTVLVCGPRFSPDSLDVPQDVEVRGYVSALHELFAASDLAIVQGGATSTLELTALRRPFLYFPLEGHFEQQVHVTGRLLRHRAGVKMSHSQVTPTSLAKKVVANLDREVTHLPIPINGAERAAQLISGLL
jgi:UDP:flavonoid glycosyltransferase YjiC (YdhE family)